MSKNSRSRSQKIDYRDVLTQRSPEHQLAVMKVVFGLVVVTVVVVYLFAKM